MQGGLNEWGFVIDHDRNNVAAINQHGIVCGPRSANGMWPLRCSSGRWRSTRISSPPRRISSPPCVTGKKPRRNRRRHDQLWPQRQDSDSCPGEPEQDPAGARNVNGRSGEFFWIVRARGSAFSIPRSHLSNSPRRHGENPVSPWRIILLRAIKLFGVGRPEAWRHPPEGQRSSVRER